MKRQLEQMEDELPSTQKVKILPHSFSVAPELLDEKTKKEPLLGISKRQIKLFIVKSSNDAYSKEKDM